jgi:hypothetical protein
VNFWFIGRALEKYKKTGQVQLKKKTDKNTPWEPRMWWRWWGETKTMQKRKSSRLHRGSESCKSTKMTTKTIFAARDLQPTAPDSVSLRCIPWKKLAVKRFQNAFRIIVWGTGHNFEERQSYSYSSWKRVLNSTEIIKSSMF